MSGIKHKYALIRCPKCFKYRTAELKHKTTTCTSCSYRISHMAVRYLYKSDYVEDIAKVKAKMMERKY